MIDGPDFGHPALLLVPRPFFLIPALKRQAPKRSHFWANLANPRAHQKPYAGGFAFSAN